MKSFRTSLAAATVVSAFVNASALAGFDNFDITDPYQLGLPISNFTGGGSSGGIDWLQWNAAQPGTNWITDSQGAPRPVSGDIGSASGIVSQPNFVRNDNNQGVTSAQFTARRRFTTQTSGIFWASVLVKTDLVFANSDNTFFNISVSDADAVGANSNVYAGQIGKVNNELNWAVRGLDQSSQTSVVIAPNTTYFLLLKVDMDSDTVSGWVNPDLSQGESTPDATDQFRLDPSGNSFTQLNEFRLRGGNGGNVWQMDNVSVTKISPFSMVADPTWISDANGDWEAGSNWSTGQAPNSVGATALFLGAITSGRTVSTSSAVTAGTLRFNNANSYTIGGTGSLSMEVVTGSALVDVQAGTHAIDVPLTLTSNTVASVAPGASLTISDTLNLAGSSTLNTSGGGTVQITGTVTTSTGGIVASEGTLVVGTNLNGASLAGNNAQIDLAASQTLASLAIDNGAVEVNDLADRLVVRTGSFDATGTAVVDLNDNALIVDYNGATPLADIVDDRDAGRLTSGLLSDATAVAVVDNASLGLASFVGQSVAATTILAARVLKGDANLSGDVGFPDLLALAQNYNTANDAWDKGDFNFDGSIGFSDLLVLAQNYNSSLALAGVDLARYDVFGAGFAQDFQLALALVPEPSTAFAVMVASILGVHRRRR